VLICYELIFPYLSRAEVKNGAGLLVNITNDAWYGKTSAPYQHFSMAVFRAVENRRALVRAANTGISGFIDPSGRITATTPIFEDAVITRDIQILKEITIYTRFGDFFAFICLAAAALTLLIKTK
jgi:apolipoprotein N-acyltransferase